MNQPPVSAAGATHDATQNEFMAKTPKLLLILDGFGIRDGQDFNAIANANTPTFDHLWGFQAHRRLISASGLNVGLPDGQMGNSEVGHMNIGAGRILYQDFTKISKAISDNVLNQNNVLVENISQAIQNNKAVHILGLLSPGGVHSHSEHIHALASLTHELGATEVYIHAFLDGRDTPPQSAAAPIQALEKHLLSLTNKAQRFAIATICGRFYAMDRDKRWDRVQHAFEGIVHNKMPYSYVSASEALTQAYQRKETDEFVQCSRTLEKYEGVQDGDSIIFANFRSDRAKELSAALFEEHFDGFDRGKIPQLGAATTMTLYYSEQKASIAFPNSIPINTLGEIISLQGKKQLRLAETEKYAHVTFFMNAGLDEPWPGEERLLIASPNVRTYDKAPAMSLKEVTAKLCHAIENKTHDLIICNFANADMVGHTGDYDAAVQAIESIDNSLTQVITSLKKVQGEALITADHGNAEQMMDLKTGQPHTAHTCEPVPLIYIGPGQIQWRSIADGRLSDLAPTILKLMNIQQPSEMTGRCLLDVCYN